MIPMWVRWALGSCRLTLRLACGPPLPPGTLPESPSAYTYTRAFAYKPRPDKGDGSDIPQQNFRLYCRERVLSAAAGHEGPPVDVHLRLVGPAPPEERTLGDA